jgi:hypothetical protein
MNRIDPALKQSAHPPEHHDPLEAALSTLDDLASHLVEESAGPETLEAGCLSCSFSKIEDRQL